MSRLDFLRRRKIGRLGSSFTPASLPNLLAHYDASVDALLPYGTFGSAAVPLMADLQGAGVLGVGPEQFAQVTPGNQPLIVSGQSPSCQPAYVPDGVSSYMLWNPGIFFAAGTQYTFFIAGNIGSAFSPDPFLYGGGGGFGVDFNLGGGPAFKAGGVTTTICAQVGGWQRQLWTIDGVAGQLSLARNGVLAGSVAWTPAALAPATLWRNGTAGTGFGVSRLGEWGIYGGIFDATAQATLDAYLKAKWFTVCV